MPRLLPFLEENEHFDTVVYGCGLREAIRAAQRADSTIVTSVEREYGAPLYTSKRTALPHRDGWFLLDKAPLVLANAGPLVSFLIDTGAAEYVRFEPVLGLVTIRSDGSKHQLPLTKEAVMLDVQFSLAQKRHLMRAFAQQSTSALPLELKDMLETALGGESLDVFIRGLGRFQPVQDRCAAAPARANAPWLVPVHGASDVVQAVCRVGALRGVTYALGQLSGDMRELSGDMRELGTPVPMCEETPERMPSGPGEDPPCTENCVLVVDRPLDRSGCWLYRVPHMRLSLLQLDESAAVCSPGLTLYHAFGASTAALDELFYFESRTSADDGRRPKVLWHARFRIPPPIVNSAAEARLFVQ